MEDDAMEYVSRDVHEEFVRRIEAEDRRQNERITALERGVQEIGKITVQVEKLATNIETMTAEIKEQGNRLKEIEGRPAKRWDAVIAAVIAGIAGIVFGALSTGLIH